MNKTLNRMALAIFWAGAAWSNHAAATSPPIFTACTLTAVPSTIVAGGASLLTTSCTPSSSSATYIWSSNAGLGGTDADGVVRPLTTTTYSVQGSWTFGSISPPAEVTVTVAPGPASVSYLPVIEFYHIGLDHYFVTSDAAEAAAIEGGSAGAGWTRVGSSFNAGGNTGVCRFYGSQSPGPNSHFFTVDANECNMLKQLQASTPATQKRWNFERLEYLSTPPVNATCPVGTAKVYRAYNNGFARGIDSNHRISGDLTAIMELVNRGWIFEGVVMCSPV
ncbi:hypothetical protein BH11PSE11_BH11PSE11_30280 [soil metagenome]